MLTLNPAAPVCDDASAPPAPLLAQLAGVHKRYRKRSALDGLSLELRKGEILVVLGPNGAGKSTAISILTGLRRADAGTVTMLGDDPREPHVRRRLGVTPQNLDFPPMLRVHEIVELVRAHFEAPLALDEVLTRFDLAHLRDRYASGLSVGEQRRLAVAVAFTGRPAIAVLDEPTTGLDVESRRAVWRSVRAFVAGGGTVLLTTHYLEEADALASRVVVVDRGRDVFSGSVDEIKSRLGIKRVLLRHAPELPVADVRTMARENERYVLRTRDVNGLVEALVARGVRFDEIDILPITLEEAFLELTEHAS
jgi:ABC-2 type transport system ATP-binding protein